MNSEWPSSRADRIALTLHVDQVSAEALAALGHAGVSCLLLKGPSIARWLYEEPGSRTYTDCDLLLRPGDEAATERALAGLGYEPAMERQRVPELWQEHASSWFSARAGLLIDLHPTLPGLRAEPTRVWSALRAEAEVLEVAGAAARVLAPRARALHIALHAAQHGSGSARPTDDLERALARVEFAQWQRAAELAALLDGIDCFAAGLRLSASGRLLADRLALPPPSDIDVILSAHGHASEARTVDLFLRSRSPRQRASIVARKLFPPLAVMRRWSPLMNRGLLGIALAYAYRPLWVAARLLPALRTWGRAWRTSRDARRAQATRTAGR